MEGGQKRLIEESKIFLFLDVDLNELENISSDTLHGPDHVVDALCPRLLVLDRVVNAFGVKLVHIDQVIENLAQIGQVSFADAQGDSLVYFDNMVDLSDHIRVHQMVRAAVGQHQNLSPIIVGIAQQFYQKARLVLSVRGDHVADAFVDSQLLVVLKVFAILWNQVYQIFYVWLLPRLIDASEHMFCQL